MKTRLWIVLLIVVAWTSFLIGYSVSALTGVSRPAAGVKGAGGYAGAAEESEAEAGGYGAGRPKAGAGGYGAADEKPKAGAGGYSGGAERPKTGGARPKAGAGGYGGKD